MDIWTVLIFIEFLILIISSFFIEPASFPFKDSTKNKIFGNLNTLAPSKFVFSEETEDKFSYKKLGILNTFFFFLIYFLYLSVFLFITGLFELVRTLSLMAKQTYEFLQKKIQFFGRAKFLILLFFAFLVSYFIFYPHLIELSREILFFLFFRASLKSEFLIFAFLLFLDFCFIREVLNKNKNQSTPS